MVRVVIIPAIGVIPGDLLGDGDTIIIIMDGMILGMVEAIIGQVHPITTIDARVMEHLPVVLVQVDRQQEVRLHVQVWDQVHPDRQSVLRSVQAVRVRPFVQVLVRVLRPLREEWSALVRLIPVVPMQRLVREVALQDL